MIPMLHPHPRHGADLHLPSARPGAVLSLRQRLVAAVLWLPLAPRTTSFRHLPEDGRRDPWVPATVSSNLADWGNPKLMDV